MSSWYSAASSGSLFWVMSAYISDKRRKTNSLSGEEEIFLGNQMVGFRKIKTMGAFIRLKNFLEHGLKVGKKRKGWWSVVVEVIDCCRGCSGINGYWVIELFVNELSGRTNHEGVECL